MINWEELSFCERRNVAVYEPREIPIIAVPDIFDKAEHQGKDTGKRTSVISIFSMWGIFVHLTC